MLITISVYITLIYLCIAFQHRFATRFQIVCCGILKYRVIQTEYVTMLIFNFSKVHNLLTINLYSGKLHVPSDLYFNIKIIAVKTSITQLVEYCVTGKHYYAFVDTSYI